MTASPPASAVMFRHGVVVAVVDAVVDVGVVVVSCIGGHIVVVAVDVDVEVVTDGRVVDVVNVVLAASS